MTTDQHIAHAAARAAIAYRNGDDLLGAYWEERAVRLSDQAEAAHAAAEAAYIQSDEFTQRMCDALKGSPDHSTVRHG